MPATAADLDRLIPVVGSTAVSVIDESPFELPAIEGLPFDDDSEEARAIERVLEEAKRERAAPSQES
jgi:hypothetical protein